MFSELSRNFENSFGVLVLLIALCFPRIGKSNDVILRPWDEEQFGAADGRNEDLKSIRYGIWVEEEEDCGSLKKVCEVHLNRKKCKCVDVSAFAPPTNDLVEKQRELMNLQNSIQNTKTGVSY